MGKTNLRIFLILLILILAVLHQTNSSWNSNPVLLPISVISTESTGTSATAKVATDSQGNIHVIWNDNTNYNGAGTDYDVFYKMWNATTQVWGTTIVISTESTSDGASPCIAIDYLGNVHVAWQDTTNYLSSGTDYDIFYKMWNASTQVWGTTIVISTDSTIESSAPTIATDSMNNVHIAWYDRTNYNSSGTDFDIFYKMWNATSQTWSTTQVVSTNSDSNSQFPNIVVDGKDNVHLCWQDLTNYNNSGTDADIFYRMWNVTTQTWGMIQVISTNSTSPSYSPVQAIDNQDNLHITWQDFTNYNGSGADWDVFYKMWNATTRTWGTTIVISTESNSDSDSPSIATDNNGNVHIVWYDTTNYNSAGTDRDIFYKMWNATTQIWSTTRVISTMSTLDSNFPSIIVDIFNDIQIVWDDLTNYNGAGTDKDIFFYESITPHIITSTIIQTTTDISTQTDTVTSTEIITQNITQPVTQNIIQTSTVTKSNLPTNTATSIVTVDHTPPASTINHTTTRTTSAPFMILPSILISFSVIVVGRNFVKKKILVR